MNKRSHFSLLELLVVISIITILAGLLMGALGGATEQQYKVETRAKIMKVDAAIQAYMAENDQDDYPLSTMGPLGGIMAYGVTKTDVQVTHTNGKMDPDDPDLPSDITLDPVAENDFYAQLLSLERFEDIVSTDESEYENAFMSRKKGGTTYSTSINNRMSGTRQAMVLDSWGHPLWIIFKEDYEESGFLYRVAGARENSFLEEYYRPDDYQIISAGPDGDFDTTRDNIYNFDVK